MGYREPSADEIRWRAVTQAECNPHSFATRRLQALPQAPIGASPQTAKIDRVDNDRSPPGYAAKRRYA